MKYALIFLWIILLSACSAVKSNNGKKANDNYKVVATPYIVDNYTTAVSELRFHQISSAKDAMKLMYNNFGRWNKKANGKYQDNIDQLIWENVNILGGKENFLVIADGTETNKAFFASLMVFDAQLNDCLHESHPLSKPVLNYFRNKMDIFSTDSFDYKLLR